MNFLATLGSARIPMQMEVGFSDDIHPGPLEARYPALLETGEFSLRCYPPETVISEKFHAIVRLDEINSRMKDFYDIWLLSDRSDFDGAVLQTAIEKTFKRRGTAVPFHAPTGLSVEFALNHLPEWRNFLRRFSEEEGSLDDMILVLARLQAFLMPPAEALNREVLFAYHWKAGKGWEEV